MTRELLVTRELPPSPAASNTVYLPARWTSTRSMRSGHGVRRGVAGVLVDAGDGHL